MKERQEEKYEAPLTKRTQVCLESGICVSSKDKVVINDENTTVNISRQGEGGSFELNTWDE